MRGHQAIVLPVSARRNCLPRGFYVVVDAALAANFENGKARPCASKTISWSIARKGPHEQLAAVIEPHVGDLHSHVAPFSTTISWLQSNRHGSPSAKLIVRHNGGRNLNTEFRFGG